MKELTDKRVSALIWWKYDLLNSERKVLTYIYYSGRDQNSLTGEEIEQIHRDATILKFDQYVKTGEVMDYGGPSFNWLYKKGFIKYTPEEKEEILEKARSQLKGRALNKQAAGVLKSKLKTVMEAITKEGRK